MKNKLTSVKNFVLAHQFLFFIIFCIVIAFVMTMISLQLYKHSGAMKLDMSRPGYEQVRSEVEKSRDDQPYSATGELNEAAIDDFNNRIDRYKQELENLGTYDNSIISDENLNLVDTPNSEQTAEE